VSARAKKNSKDGTPRSGRYARVPGYCSLSLSLSLSLSAAAAAAADIGVADSTFI
jgi:hypothetical protein